MITCELCASAVLIFSDFFRLESLWFT